MKLGSSSRRDFRRMAPSRLIRCFLESVVMATPGYVAGRHGPELPDAEGNTALPHAILSEEDRAGIEERVKDQKAPAPRRP